MSKRDRLKSYRKNAAAGKLDQNQTHADTESPDVANNATTRKDSVQMDNGTASTLKKMMQGVLGAGVKIKPENSFGAINTLLSVFGMRLGVATIIANDEKGDYMITAFNPHFKNCGCDKCKHTVESIKEFIIKTDELGRPPQ